MAGDDSDYSDDDKRGRHNAASDDDEDGEYRLTSEQKKAAKLLTQALEGQNANAAYKERSEIREQYFVMSTKLQEATRELTETGHTDLIDTEEGINEFEAMIGKSREYYDKIGASSKELACDSKCLSEMGKLMKASMQKLHNAHLDKILRPKDFAEKIMEMAPLINEEPIKLVSSDAATADLLDDSEDEDAFLPRNAKKRLPEGVEDDGDMPATAWAAFGRKYGGFLKIAPTLTYFRPLLQDTAPLPTQPKAKKERLPKEDKTKAKAVVLSEKDKNHDDPDQSVTKELDCIRKSLRREMKKRQSHVIPYYAFVIDPEDFSKSVENMFYTSFLVKDNFIKIEIDQQKGIPVIVLQGVEGGGAGGGAGEDAAAAQQGRGAAAAAAATAAPSNPAAAAAVAGQNCAATQQAIVGFAYDIWEGMIECLNITEAVIRR